MFRNLQCTRLSRVSDVEDRQDTEMTRDETVSRGLAECTGAPMGFRIQFVTPRPLAIRCPCPEFVATKNNRIQVNTKVAESQVTKHGTIQDAEVASLGMNFLDGT